MAKNYRVMISLKIHLLQVAKRASPFSLRNYVYVIYVAGEEK
jgi:hypothetical protein